MRKLAAGLLLVCAALLVVSALRTDWWRHKQRRATGAIGLTKVESCANKSGKCEEHDLSLVFKDMGSKRWQNLGELTHVLCVLGVPLYAALALLAFFSGRKSAGLSRDRGLALTSIIYASGLMLFAIAFVAHAPKLLVSDASLSWGWPRTWFAGICAIAAGALLLRLPREPDAETEANTETDTVAVTEGET